MDCEAIRCNSEIERTLLTKQIIKMSEFSKKVGEFYKWIIILLIGLVVGVMVAGVLVLNRSDAGIEAKEKTFILKKESGYVKNMDKLLADLLLIQDESVDTIKTVDDLNRRYKAFTFSLPFAGDIELNSESSFVHTSDIRLEDIDPTFIVDEKNRDFFYNSNLQSLLEKQRTDKSINCFKICFVKDDGQLRIRSITLSPSLFRVEHEKKVWNGTIMATDNQLFPESEYCFLSWGNDIVPIKHCESEGNRNVIFTADLSTHSFFTVQNDTQAPINPVKLSMGAYNRRVNCIVLHINDESGRIGTAFIKYVDSTTLLVKADERIRCVFYVIGNQAKRVNPTTAACNYDSIDFSRDLKVVFYNKNNKKLSEMMLSHKNPIFMMSCPIRNNKGLSRYIVDASLTDRFMQQVVHGAYSMLADNDINESVQLTLDPYLSKWLEEEMKVYINSLRSDFRARSIGRDDDRWEMSVTVLDMRTGDVIAMPYYRTEDEKLPRGVAMSRKNPALTRRYIGSTFKPLLTLSAVQTVPELLNLNTVGRRYYNYKGKDTAYMFGALVAPWATSSGNHWMGRQSIETFLAASCDVYPVALTILAMNNGQWPGTAGEEDIFNTDHRLRFKSEEFVVTSRPFIKNLDALYDLYSYDASENSTDPIGKMDSYIWRNIPGWDKLSEDQSQSVDVVTPDATVMDYGNFYEKTDVRGNLVPWVLGQGSNSWSCLKLAEAWCRMLTKRRVRASIAASKATKADLIALSPQDDIDRSGLWNSFLDKLSAAQSLAEYNMLSPMYKVLDTLNNNMQLTNKDSLVLFSKTGTPNQYSREEYLHMGHSKLQYDIGLYCMGLMSRGAFDSVKNNQEGDGVMCVIRITRISTKKDPARVTGLWSTDARNFFSNNLQRFQEFYWLTRNHFWRTSN